MKYTGNFTVIPSIVPSALNRYEAIPYCGTQSTANPPTGDSFCIAFQDVGDFDTPASEVIAAPDGIADSGRIFVGTWAPRASNPNSTPAGIFMSPVVPAGGLTPGSAGQWNKVWNAGGYEPDPILKLLAYGVGAMSFYNGYLYWGTLNPPLSSVNLLFQTYGKPTDPQTIVTDGLRANRTAVLLRAQNFSAASAPSINNLLYRRVQSAGLHRGDSHHARALEPGPKQCTQRNLYLRLWDTASFRTVWIR